MPWREISKKTPKDKSTDAELEQQGWTKRFVMDEPRLSEVVELYKFLGYEVKLDPIIFDKTNKECRNASYPNIVRKTRRFT